MSQFIVFKKIHEFVFVGDYIVLPVEGNTFYKKRMSELIQSTSISEYYYLDLYKNCCFDDIYTQAEAALKSNGKLINTELYEVLNTVLNNTNEIFIWYGNYYDDLELFNIKKIYWTE